VKDSNKLLHWLSVTNLIRSKEYLRHLRHVSTHRQNEFKIQTKPWRCWTRSGGIISPDSKICSPQY